MKKLEPKTEKPLFSKVCLLEKYPGKGGWTYAQIPEILQDKTKPFGWVKVKGSIDDFKIKSYTLMPMGQGRLFLPIKSEIRKKIGKKEGDRVNIVLFADEDPLEIPAELLMCLKDEPQAHKIFSGFTEGEQKAYITWILSAKKIETKADRIAKTITRLLNRQKFNEK